SIPGERVWTYGGVGIYVGGQRETGREKGFYFLDCLECRQVFFLGDVFRSAGGEWKGFSTPPPKRGCELEGIDPTSNGENWQAGSWIHVNSEQRGCLLVRVVDEGREGGDHDPLREDAGGQSCNWPNRQYTLAPGHIVHSLGTLSHERHTHLRPRDHRPHREAGGNARDKQDGRDQSRRARGTPQTRPIRGAGASEAQGRPESRT